MENRKPLSKEQLVELFRANLLFIRKLLGLRTEELARKVGVTKQTINNLESGRKKPMSIPQYIAIRTVIDYQVKQMKDAYFYQELIDYVCSNDVQTKDFLFDHTRENIAAWKAEIDILSLDIEILERESGIIKQKMQIIQMDVQKEKIQRRNKISKKSNNMDNHTDFQDMAEKIKDMETELEMKTEKLENLYRMLHYRRAMFYNDTLLTCIKKNPDYIQTDWLEELLNAQYEGK